MAINFEMNAELRDDTGKGASRRLRRDGKVPAILYGAGEEPKALTLSHIELLRNLEHEAFYSHILTIKMGGEQAKAVIRDMQRHPSKPFILHLDLMRVSESESIRMHVPIHCIGEDKAPGVKAGGMVTHDLIEVVVDCLPKDLPEYIDVDISDLELGGSLHLSDLVMPEGVTLVELARGEGHDLTVVSIHVRRGGAEEEEAEAEGEEAGESGEGGEGA